MRRGTSTVSKPTIVITPTEFLKLIEEIRLVTDADSDRSNVEITNKYNARVNTTVKKLFIENRIPVVKLKSPHALRKIWVNYLWKHSAPECTSLLSCISEKLGHDPEFVSDSANYYSTINVETSYVLTENQANAVNEAKRRTIENKDAMNELKEELKEMPAVVVSIAESKQIKYQLDPVKPNISKPLYNRLVAKYKKTSVQNESDVGDINLFKNNLVKSCSSSILCYDIELDLTLDAYYNSIELQLPKTCHQYMSYATIV